MSILESFEAELNKAFFDAGVLGVDASEKKRDFLGEDSENQDMKPLVFLDDINDIFEILEIIKNKKLNVNTKKSKIRKFLKDPEDLHDFLESILNVGSKKKETKKKKENTEAMSAGAGVGTFEGPLFTKKETKEALSSGSAGQYSTPKIWAKSLKKKDWRGKSKPQIPGGKFVQVKKRCKKFPYCNQGDINALKIFENKTLANVIERTSKKYGLPKRQIVNIIIKEIKTNRKN